MPTEDVDIRIRASFEDKGASKEARELSDAFDKTALSSGKAAKSIDKLGHEVEETAKDLKKSDIETRDLRKSFTQMNLATQKLSKGFDDVGKSIKGTTGHLKVSLASIGDWKTKFLQNLQLVNVGVVAVTSSFRAFGGIFNRIEEEGKKLGTFTSALNRIQISTSATNEQMQAMSRYFKQLGRAASIEEGRLAKAFAKYVSVGASQRQAAEALVQTLNLARDSGIEFEEIVEGIWDSFKASPEGLTKWGVGVAHLTQLELARGEAVKEIEKIYGKNLITITRTDEYIGEIKNKWTLFTGELYKSLGDSETFKFIMKEASEFMSSVMNNTPNLGKWIDESIKKITVFLIDLKLGLIKIGQVIVNLTNQWLLFQAAILAIEIFGLRTAMAKGAAKAKDAVKKAGSKLKKGAKDAAASGVEAISRAPVKVARQGSLKPSSLGRPIPVSPIKTPAVTKQQKALENISKNTGKTADTAAKTLKNNKTSSEKLQNAIKKRNVADKDFVEKNIIKGFERQGFDAQLRAAGKRRGKPKKRIGFGETSDRPIFEFSKNRKAGFGEGAPRSPLGKRKRKRIGFGETSMEDRVPIHEVPRKKLPAGIGKRAPKRKPFTTHQDQYDFRKGGNFQAKEGYSPIPEGYSPIPITATSEAQRFSALEGQRRKFSKDYHDNIQKKRLARANFSPAAEKEMRKRIRKKIRDDIKKNKALGRGMTPARRKALEDEMFLLERQRRKAGAISGYGDPPGFSEYRQRQKEVGLIASAGGRGDMQTYYTETGHLRNMRFLQSVPMDESRYRDAITAQKRIGTGLHQEIGDIFDPRARLQYDPKISVPGGPNDKTVVIRDWKKMQFDDLYHGRTTNMEMEIARQDRIAERTFKRNLQARIDAESNVPALPFKSKRKERLDREGLGMRDYDRVLRQKGHTVYDPLMQPSTAHPDVPMDEFRQTRTKHMHELTKRQRAAVEKEVRKQGAVRKKLLDQQDALDNMLDQDLKRHDTTDFKTWEFRQDVKRWEEAMKKGRPADPQLKNAIPNRAFELGLADEIPENFIQRHNAASGLGNIGDAGQRDLGYNVSRTDPTFSNPILGPKYKTPVNPLPNRTPFPDLDKNLETFEKNAQSKLKDPAIQQGFKDMGTGAGSDGLWNIVMGSVAGSALLGGLFGSSKSSGKPKSAMSGSAVSGIKASKTGKSGKGMLGKGGLKSAAGRVGLGALGLAGAGVALMEAQEVLDIAAMTGEIGAALDADAESLTALRSAIVSGNFKVPDETQKSLDKNNKELGDIQGELGEDGTQSKTMKDLLKTQEDERKAAQQALEAEKQRQLAAEKHVRDTIEQIRASSVAEIKAIRDAAITSDLQLSSPELTLIKDVLESGNQVRVADLDALRALHDSVVADGQSANKNAGELLSDLGGLRGDLESKMAEMQDVFDGMAASYEQEREELIRYRATVAARHAREVENIMRMINAQEELAIKTGQRDVELIHNLNMQLQASQEGFRDVTAGIDKQIAEMDAQFSEQKAEYRALADREIRNVVDVAKRAAEQRKSLQAASEEQTKTVERQGAVAQNINSDTKALVQGQQEQTQTLRQQLEERRQSQGSYKSAMDAYLQNQREMIKLAVMGDKTARKTIEYFKIDINGMNAIKRLLALWRGDTSVAINQIKLQGAKNWPKYLSIAKEIWAEQRGTKHAVQGLGRAIQKSSSDSQKRRERWIGIRPISSGGGSTTPQSTIIDPGETYTPRTDRPADSGLGGGTVGGSGGLTTNRDPRLTALINKTKKRIEELKKTIDENNKKIEAANRSLIDLQAATTKAYEAQEDFYSKRREKEIIAAREAFNPYRDPSKKAGYREPIQLQIQIGDRKLSEILFDLQESNQRVVA